MLLRRIRIIATNIQLTNISVNGYKIFTKLMLPSAAMAITNFKPLRKNVLAVSWFGRAYDLSTVGINPITKVALAITTAIMWLPLVANIVKEIAAANRQNQSRRVMFWCPCRIAKTKIINVATAVRPVIHDPAPAPADCWVKNISVLKTLHINQESACGLVWFRKTSRMYKP